MLPCKGPSDIQNTSTREGDAIRYPDASPGARGAAHEAHRSEMLNLRGFRNARELKQFQDVYYARAFQHDLAAVASVSGHRISNFGSLVSRYLPRFQGPDNAARRLNDWMLNARDTGRNLFQSVEFWADRKNLSAQFQFSQVVRDTHAEYLRIATPKGLTRQQLDRNWLDLVDLGLDQRPIELNQNGTTRWQQQRKATYQQRLVERLTEQGFTPDEINQLRDMLRRQAAVYDGALGVASVNRVQIDELDGRYNPRFYTPEMADIMRKARIEEMGLNPNSTQYFSSGSDRLMSRNTFEWGVNDELLLADALGMRQGQTPGRQLYRDMERIQKDYERLGTRITNRPKGRTDAQQAAMERRFSEMSDRLAEVERGIAQGRVEALGALQEHLLDDRTLTWDFVQMNSETLDRLVDNGVVGKLPLHTTRVLDVMVERYQLPDFITGDVGRAVITDPVQSFNMYRDSLSRVMGDSMLINEMHVNAVYAGFGVTTEAYRANPAAYPGHRPMGTLMDKYNIPSTNDAARGIYLDEYSFNQMDAILNLSTEPAATNALARVWNDYTRYWKTSILGNLDFVYRNSIESVIQGWRAGTNLAHVQPAMQYYRDFLRFGPDSLPTEKMFGGGKYSVRDIFESLVQTGEIQMASPMTTSRVGFGTGASDDYRRLRNMAGYSPTANLGRDATARMRYMAHQFTHGDIVGGTQSGLGNVAAAQRNVFSTVTAPLAFMTDSIRVANMFSTLDSGPRARIGQFMTGQRRSFDNLVDAKRHLNEYIFRYDRGGLGDRMASRVIPFWNYFSTSMPASLRNMIDNPAQHMAYQRLYAAVNGDAREDEEFSEAATAPWFGNQMPIVFRDPNGRDNMWFSVDMSRLDPHMDLIRRLSQSSDNIARARGRQVGRFDQQLRDQLGLSDGDFFKGLSDQFSGPITNAITATITQANPWTGQDFQETDTWLGIDIGPVGPVSGGFLKYMASIAAPQLNYIDRTLRNQGVINSTNSRDTESPNSYINAAGEVDVRPEIQSAIVRALSITGFGPQLIEGARNLQRSESSLHWTAVELRREAGATLNRARAERDPEKQDELLLRVARQRAAAEHVDMVRDIIRAKLEEDGMPTTTERNEMIREESTERVNEQIQGDDRFPQPRGRSSSRPEGPLNSLPPAQ